MEHTTYVATASASGRQAGSLVTYRSFDSGGATRGSATSEYAHGDEGRANRSSTPSRHFVYSISDHETSAPDHSKVDSTPCIVIQGPGGGAAYGNPCSYDPFDGYPVYPQWPFRLYDEDTSDYNCYRHSLTAEALEQLDPQPEQPRPESPTTTRYKETREPHELVAIGEVARSSSPRSGLARVTRIRRTLRKISTSAGLNDSSSRSGSGRN